MYTSGASKKRGRLVCALCNIAVLLLGLAILFTRLIFKLDLPHGIVADILVHVALYVTVSVGTTIFLGYANNKYWFFGLTLILLTVMLMDFFCITFWLLKWLAPDDFLVKEIDSHGGEFVTSDGNEHVGLYTIAFCGLTELILSVACFRAAFGHDSSSVKDPLLTKTGSRSSPRGQPHIVSTSYRPANDFQCGGKGGSRGLYHEDEDDIVNQPIEVQQQERVEWSAPPV